MKIDNKAFMEYMNSYKKEWGSYQPDHEDILIKSLVNYKRHKNRITKIKNILKCKAANGTK